MSSGSTAFFKFEEHIPINILITVHYFKHLETLCSSFSKYFTDKIAHIRSRFVIHNDIVDNIDNSKVTALTLLDLSTAFDTIDHSSFLQRLHGHFGISGTALFDGLSYFSDKHQRITTSGTLSCPQHLPFGVPQGSVLGSVLFSLCTTSLSQVITNHNLSHPSYADDTQVYISLSQSNAQESFSTVSDCLTYILF